MVSGRPPAKDTETGAVLPLLVLLSTLSGHFVEGVGPTPIGVPQTPHDTASNFGAVVGILICVIVFFKRALFKVVL